MIYREVVQTANHLVGLVPLLGGSASRKDYHEALALMDYLLEHEPGSPLVAMLSAKIEEYEDNAPEFAAFNARVNGASSGVALLRVLMDQYHLKQTDFVHEIGHRSVVSRILKGERQLTLNHMRALAARFAIPVSRFVG